MISVREISKSFGPIRAVDRVGFELGRSSVAGLLGPNGAGKSTTIRMITGYLAPDAGSVSIDGHDVHHEPSAAKRALGYLPESAPIYPEMSVRGSLRHRARLMGVASSETRRAADHAMDLCELSDVARRRVGHLSKGYRQRVGLAGALVHDPPVLILDEPTSGLDPTQVLGVRALIRDLAARKTMLICSHILTEVERVCDRVMIMHDGRIHADGAPGDLVAGAPGAREYRVEVRANPSAGIAHCRRVLGSIGGIERAEAASEQPGDAAHGWCRLILVGAEGEPDLREAIAGTASDHGLFIRELSPTRATLESYFLDLLDPDRARGDPEPEPAQ